MTPRVAAAVFAVVLVAATATGCTSAGTHAIGLLTTGSAAADVHGEISGQLVISPPMSSPYPSAGSIEITGSKRIVVTVGASGKFKASVQAGRYQVVGHSPHFGASKYDCIVGHAITVRARRTTVVAVVCQEK